MTELQTTVTAVVVYPDRARVTRTGKVTLQPGSQRLEITELPLALDPDSVRASARGTARARLLGVDVQRRFYAETPTERVRELEQQIEALQDQMKTLDAQVVVLEEERKAVQGLAGATRVFARGLANGKTTPADQMALYDVLRKRIEEANAAQQRLAVERRGWERQLQKAQKELSQLSNTRGRERHTVVIEVEMLEAGDFTIELTCIITPAGWTPLYDLRLSEAREQPTLEVGYLAQVRQSTGEDWMNVALTLSTARPALAKTLPELDPWYIEPRPPSPMPPPMPRAPRMAAAAPMMMAKAITGAEPEGALMMDQVEAEVMMATVESAGAAVTYSVPAAVTLPADGAPHKVTVAMFPLTPTLDYVTAPKLVEAVYRRAKVANASPYTLLPGDADLFAGDEFIGATKLELVAPGGEIELYVGADDRVKVERELKRREVDKKLLGDRRRMRYGYEIRLENLLTTPAKLTLHDQIPVARREEIKVRLESADPSPTEQTELNLLRWELTLAPKEKRVVRFDFSIEFPRAMDVIRMP
jgi:uncharacterized protein (TIGR02231 family)